MVPPTSTPSGVPVKEKFQDVRFNDRDLQLIEICNQLIDRYMASGFTLSVRQLYYQLVTLNAIPNNVKAYTHVGRVISDARLAGLVDWSAIVDRGRPYQKVALWDSASSIVDSISLGFKLDRWKNQPCYIEVMVEKQALEGVLGPVCNKYGVGLTANKGYSSSTALHETSKRLLNALRRGKTPVVLYLGDHDPSGVDMTRDVRDRLSLFCGSSVDVKRLSLNKSQIDEHQIPPNPAKMSDSRAVDYVAKHGQHSWELDAIPPEILAGYVRNAIKRRLDEAAWNASAIEEEKHKARLKSIVGVLKKFESGKGPECSSPQPPKTGSAED